MRTMLLIVSVAAVALQTPAPYLITHTYNVGGDGSWDYIVPDPASHRLFIGRQDRVMVVERRQRLPARRRDRDQRRARNGDRRGNAATGSQRRGRTGRS